MGVRTYPKGSQWPVAADFRAYEFDCPCGSCTETLIDDDLVLGLQLMRDKLFVGVIIDSGYRCQAHQNDLTAQGYETAEHSQHLLGKAADVRTPKDSGEELEAFARKAGFKSVGVAKTWIHLDTRSTYRRWVYLKR